VLLSRLLGSSTFRYAIIYMMVFGISVVSILGFVYWRTVEVIAAQTDDTVDAEIVGLAEQYQQRGLVGLLRVVRARSDSTGGNRGLYLLADRDFTPIAGNLSHWPTIGRGDEGWIDFLIDAPPEDAGPRAQVARARTFVLPGEYRLLVGRDLTERTEFTRLMRDTLIAGLLLTFAVSLLGGLLMSRGLLARIEAINRGTAAILGGDLSRRMPIAGNDDEFDRLARSLNEMLDQIETLMAGIRGVGDSLAHDLRSPINRLRSRVEYTLLGPRDVETYRRALQETVEEIDRILATFNALLDIALAESGALRDRFVPVDLVAIVADLGELYGPLAEEKAVTLSVGPAMAARVAGNHHLLSQAVSNLIDNAIKYTAGGGHIRLSVEPDGAGASLIVADDGPGIPADSRADVLRRFVRLDASRHEPGSGLGLSLVAAVARLHRATLSLEDAKPGLRVVLRFSETLPPTPGTLPLPTRRQAA
jgi:signal transduction histidine kinase